MKDTLRQRLQLQINNYVRRIEGYEKNLKLSVKSGHYYNAYRMNLKIKHLQEVVGDLEDILNG